MDCERYIELSFDQWGYISVSLTVNDFWKSCNGVRKVTELVDWVVYATDKGLTAEQIDEGKNVIDN